MSISGDSGCSFSLAPERWWQNQPDTAERLESRNGRVLVHKGALQGVRKSFLPRASIRSRYFRFMEVVKIAKNAIFELLEGRRLPDSMELCRILPYAMLTRI